MLLDVTTCRFQDAMTKAVHDAAHFSKEELFIHKHPVMHIHLFPFDHLTYFLHQVAERKSSQKALKRRH